MITWNEYKDFSPEFLAKYHDLVLMDIYHHVKACFLYPPLLQTEVSPQDLVKREHDSKCRAKIILSLNVECYNKALQKNRDSECLHAMRSLWRIPEESFFRERYGEAYPLWLIEQEFEKREKESHFKIVDRLVWTLLRLVKTYEMSPWRASRASINEALEILLGRMPLKAKISQQRGDAYLGGEKAYRKYLKTYKSICHFIAAFEFIKKSKQLFSFKSPEEIEKFLEISCWFRTKLLSLLTPNVKENAFFLEEDLLSLPSWVKKVRVDIPVEPFEDKLQEINYAFETAEPMLSTRDQRR